jgi:hypothetical protein
MSLSECTKCGGHIPIGPNASNVCEECGAGVFALPDSASTEDAMRYKIASDMAKAEMVKRGFYFHYHIYLGDHRVAVCTVRGGRVSANHMYDPTDPVSEAAAVLRCCADALQSNTPDRQR